MFTSSYRPSPYPAQYFSPSSPAFCSRSPWLSWRCASAPPQEPPSATYCPTWLGGGWSDTTSLPGLLSGQPRWTVTGPTFSHTFSSFGLLHFFRIGEHGNMSIVRCLILSRRFINIVSPVIGVPLLPFWIGTFFGVAPPSFIFIQAGTTLQQLTSTMDPITVETVLLLVVFALLSLLPIVLKNKLKAKFE